MRHRSRTSWMAGLITGSMIVSAGASGAEWPQWRGPDRDGTVKGASAPARWPESLTPEWSVTVGEGVASPVVAGDDVFLLTRQRPNEEVILCLDLQDGNERWRVPYDAPYQVGGPARGYEGPRSTPAISGGRLFTYGISGILSCVDTKDGRLVWRKEFTKQFPETAPVWGTAGSPLIVGDLCIVHVGGWSRGGLTAFDVKSGDVRWTYEGDVPAYASPLCVDLAGERQIVTLTLHNFVGVSAATGKLFWQVPCDEIHGENCQTPVLFRDLLIFAGRKETLRAIRLERTSSGITPREAWKAKKPTVYMSTPVLAGDYLFGFSDQKVGHLFCLAPASGSLLWQGPGRQGANASILNVDSVLLALISDGRLLVIKQDAKKYEQLAEYRVADNPTYSHPVFLGERILVKDAYSLRSFRIK